MLRRATKHIWCIKPVLPRVSQIMSSRAILYIEMDTLIQNEISMMSDRDFIFLRTKMIFKL